MHDESSAPQPDVLVNNVGTLYTFCPLTLRAKEWIDEHVQERCSVVRARTYRRASLCVGTGSGDEGRRAGAGVRRPKDRG